MRDARSKKKITKLEDMATEIIQNERRKNGLKQKLKSISSV